MNTTEWREYWKSHDPYKETKSKRCYLCGKEKAGVLFYRCRSNCTGLQSQCIDCVKKRPSHPPHYKSKTPGQYMDSWREGNAEYWKTHDAYLEVESKRCTHCKTPKPSRQFHKSWVDKDGLQAWCIDCLSKRHRDNPRRLMLVNARARSRRKGLEFHISEEDIVIPEVCPVLGIPIIVGNGAQIRGSRVSDNSPTLDRKDNNRGYTPENVCVISWRANSLKRDASIGEMEKVLAYMRRP